MMRQRSPAGEATVAEFLPYGYHVSPSVISLEGMQYMSVWRLGGRSPESGSPQQRMNWTEEINNLLRTLGDANVGIWAHTIRHRVREYREGEFDQVFCQRLDRAYAERFRGQNLFVNDLYLSILIRPSVDPALAVFSKLEKRTANESRRWQSQALRQMKDLQRAISNTLRRYSPELLTLYEVGGHVYSAPGEFLARLANAAQQILPIGRSRMADAICSTRPLFSRWGEIVELRSAARSNYAAMLELRDYPARTVAGQLDELLSAPFECVLTQSFGMLSKHAGRQYLSNQVRLMTDAGDASETQMVELSEALDQLEAGNLAMGEHHATLAVFADDPEQARDNLSRAASLMLSAGIIAKPVDLALEAAWWAQFPGNWKWRPRPAAITSRNFGCFASMHNQLSGKATGNPWGPAITMLKTKSGGPFFFNFHATLPETVDTGRRVAGNTMVIGKTGTGKTVLLGLLLAQMQRVKPRVVVFDKDKGMQPLVQAMGGRYFVIEEGRNTGFNPFQLAPEKKHIAFLKRLVALAISQDGQAVTHADQAAIDAAVDTVMLHMPKGLRRPAVLLQSLPLPPAQPEHPSVHLRWQRWCAGHENGWLLDSAEDDLDLHTHSLYGFDLTSIVDNAAAREVFNSYVMHRTDELDDGRPYAFVFDEFQHSLRDQGFQQMAQNENRVIRKKNGIFVYATQEPGAILDSAIAKTLVQQAATKIFLPNPDGRRDEYVDGFGLTNAEFDLLMGLGEFSRRALIKQASSVAIVEIDLAGMEDLLLVLSGTPDRAAMLEELIGETGDAPELWLDEYINRAKQAQGVTA